jgi:hypothetical protein
MHRFSQGVLFDSSSYWRSEGVQTSYQIYHWKQQSCDRLMLVNCTVDGCRYTRPIR